MVLNNNDAPNNEGSLEPEEKKPNAYRVEDDSNPEEKDLERSFLFGNDDDDVRKPVMEGKPMGGQSFGENNLTPSGDDKNNPSQNAGYTNAYFRRTEPSEEHPEDTNFKPQNQEGRPEYGGKEANDSQNDKPDKQNNEGPHPQQPYREGTADDD